MGTLFTFFISLCVFAILNVVTGVFCQSAIESAQSDKDLVTMNLLHDRERLQSQFAKIFSDLDLDSSGELTIDELESVLMQRHSQAYLQSLGVEVSDAWTLL